MKNSYFTDENRIEKWVSAAENCLLSLLCPGRFFYPKLKTCVSGDKFL